MPSPSYQWRRVDLESGDWQAAVEKSVRQGRNASQTEGYSALTLVAVLLAAASGGLYLLVGASPALYIAVAIFLSALSICYVLVRMLVGVETSLTVISTFLELYGNQITKQLSPNQASERSRGTTD